MVNHKAQELDARPRTEDILITEDINFKLMLLPTTVLKGLSSSGYVKPSPIQRKALPLVRCGLDLIVQSKAGTGKTCVFAVAALEIVKPTQPTLQALVLAPTREIALQITDVIKSIGQAIEGLKVHCFIGGYPVSVDKKNARGCHIAIGAPGRLKHLIEKGILETKHVRLFVLDEADKLMETSFSSDINEIFSYLPESKQVLALSATYTPEMVQFLKNYMHQGQHVLPQSNSSTTVLIGIHQFISVLSHHVDHLARLRLKERHLIYLLSSISFNQCLVFSNIRSRAVSLCNMLRKEGWASDWIAGHQKQADRVIALSQLKEQRIRILITTDLTARGIDAENVNLIINLDVPRDYETYLHRMGRAGRYGTHGIVITVLTTEDELVEFRKLLGAIGGTEQSVNCLPEDLRNTDLWSSTDDTFNHVFGIVEMAESSEVIDQSQGSSSTGAAEGKLAEESSNRSDGVVLNVCNESCVPTTETCSCNLYNAEPSDIKSITSSTLFAVSRRDEQWRDVLPVVVNESQLPLNTPVALMDSKFIRIKNLPDNKEVEVENVKATNPIRLSDSMPSVNETKFLTYDEIQSTLESDSNSEINLEHTSATSYDFMSSQEIEEFLENNESIGEVHKEIETNSKSVEIANVLKKFENSKKKLENILIGFDSFDVVGWMAVDKVHNIIENIINDKLDVMKFTVVDCSAGKKHINVISSFGTSVDEEGNFENLIFTLNLESLGLVQPFSLETIAEKLKPLISEQPSIKSSTDNSSKTGQVCNIPYPCQYNKNRYKEKCKEKQIPNVIKQNQSTMSIKDSSNSDVSNNVIKESRINHDTQKSHSDGNGPLKNGFKLKSEVTSKFQTQNSDYTTTNITDQNKFAISNKPSIKSNYDLLSESNSNVEKRLCHINGISPVKIMPKQGEKVESCFDNSQEQLQERNNMKSSSTTVYLNRTHLTKNCVNALNNSNENSTELSSLSASSSSTSSSKTSSNFDRNDDHQYRSASTSNPSGSYVDMTQNLAEWQKLHDYDEFDSKSNSELAVLEPNVNQYSSDSTSSNIALYPSKNRRLPRKSKYPHCKHVSSDSYDTYTSGVSNHNSFRTACSKHLTSGEVSDDDFYISPYNHHYLNSYQSSHRLGHKTRHDNIDNKSLYNSSPAHVNVGNHLPSNSCPRLSKGSTNKPYPSNIPHQYSEPGIGKRSKSQKKSSTKTSCKHSIPNQSMGNTSCQFSKRLRSNNLFSEWYSKWYTELRYRSTHLAYIEYIKMMSTP